MATREAGLVGCRWRARRHPSSCSGRNPADPNILFSRSAATIMISDMPAAAAVMPPTPPTGGIILRSTTGASLSSTMPGFSFLTAKGPRSNYRAERDDQQGGLPQVNMYARLSPACDMSAHR